MASITAVDYAAYGGMEIPDAEFAVYAERASEAVDAATGWKLAQMIDIDTGLNAFTLKQVKLACCAQTENLFMNGIETALDGGSSSGDGYNIGKASITVMRSSGSGGGSGTAGLCVKAWQALVPTGLLYTGVDALC